MLPDDAKTVISSILAAVASRDYPAAIALTDSARCSADDLERVRQGFKEPLILPLHEFLDVLPVLSDGDQRWSVTAPFWNPIENTRSDLEMRFTVSVINKTWTIELDDILVG